MVTQLGQWAVGGGQRAAGLWYDDAPSLGTGFANRGAPVAPRNRGWLEGAQYHNNAPEYFAIISGNGGVGGVTRK